MPKTEEKTRIHLLIRYSDNTAPSSGTIEEHNKIILEQGYVWFGKFGRRIGRNIGIRLNGQIEDHKETYLFLVGHKQAEDIYITRLLGMAYSVPSKEASGIPAYYRDKVKLVGTWMKIGKIWRADRSILRSLDSRSGIPALEIIGKSMTGHIIIRVPDGFTPKIVGACEA